MYGKSHCIQFFKIKLMSPSKIFNYKLTQLVELYKNVSKLNLYNDSLLSSKNSGDIPPIGNARALSPLSEIKYPIELQA